MASREVTRRAGAMSSRAAVSVDVKEAMLAGRTPTGSTCNRWATMGQPHSILKETSGEGRDNQIPALRAQVR